MIFASFFNLGLGVARGENFEMPKCTLRFTPKQRRFYFLYSSPIKILSDLQ